MPGHFDLDPSARDRPEPQTRIAKLIVEGAEHELPLVTGTEGEVGVDISRLAGSGVMTLDRDLGNTAECESGVCYSDWSRGILRYRGYPIEELAEEADLLEVSFLLVYGERPDRRQKQSFAQDLGRAASLDAGLRQVWESLPAGAHPVAVLSVLVAALQVFHPPDRFDVDESVVRLLAKLPVLAGLAYRKSEGRGWIDPRTDLGPAGHLLHMMFSEASSPLEIPPDVERALEVCLILHADHDRNNSRSVVRMVGGSRSDAVSSILAGIGALGGPNDAWPSHRVIDLLETIQRDRGNVAKYVEMAKDGSSGFRLPGIRLHGASYDPRIRVLRQAVSRLLDDLEIVDALVETALRLEEALLTDDYFVEGKSWPTIDFYSALLHRAIGIPPKMFTVLFALGRLPGWLAHWKEQLEDPHLRPSRPRQIYVGARERGYRRREDDLRPDDNDPRAPTD